MIVATAGHVDHGKTLLVKALTGVDTDRLPEEKKRGLTIDLGFAYHDLGNGELTGFVDVPGHERFIRTMLAGVSGIDFVIFVVAADDGPMPQTAEHLAIMDQLKVSNGIVALTKVDRVSDERVAEVTDQITQLLAHTCLRNATISPLSAVTGIGVQTLREAICTAARELPARRLNGNFRLAVDRSFLLAGAGRVVTGTVFSGSVAVGDELKLAPLGASVRVREVHAQNQAADRAVAGQRCALNITGNDLRRAEIHRGDWLVADPVCLRVNRFDARVHVLAGEERPMRNRTPVHVHIGAADLTGRVITVDGGEITPGTDKLVQIQLDKSTTTVRGDRIILRDQSALRTVGGGIVVDPLPLMRKRSKVDRLNYLQAMEAEAVNTSLREAIEHLDIISLNNFKQAWNLSPDEADSLWADVEMIVVDDANQQIGIRPQRWHEINTAITQGLGAWHAAHPDRIGVNDEELRTRLAVKLRPAVYAMALAELVASNKVVRDAGLVRLPTHSAVRSAAEQALWNKVSALLSADLFRPPVVHDMLESVGASFPELSKFLGKAAREGQLVKVSDRRYFMPQALRDFIQIVEDLVGASPNGQFTVKQYRDHAGIGRNAVIEILEYFDRSGYTLRLDQTRKIRKPATTAFNRLFE